MTDTGFIVTTRNCVTAELRETLITGLNIKDEGDAASAMVRIINRDGLRHWFVHNVRPAATR